MCELHVHHMVHEKMQFEFLRFTNHSGLNFTLLHLFSYFEQLYWFRCLTKTITTSEQVLEQGNNQNTQYSIRISNMHLKI